MFSRLGRLRIQAPLSFRLLLYILLASSVFTIGAASIQVYTDYRQDVDLVENRLSVIERGHMSSLASSVWALDENLLHVQMESILSLPDIEQVRLEMDSGDTIVKGGFADDAETITHRFELSQEEDQARSLGTVTITATKTGVYENLRRKIAIIVTTQAFRTFFISLLIVWIFQHVVARHLATMAEYARNFSLRNLSTPLILDRPDTRTTGNDELAQVTEAINNMRTRLQDDLERQTADAREIQKLSMALEQSPSSVLICDGRWRIEYANTKFLQLSGHSHDSIIGCHPAELSQYAESGSDARQLWEDIRLQVQRVGVWQGELHSTRENGERFWEQVIVTPIRDASGEPTHYLILGEDISVRKRYEQQLLRQANYDVLTGLPNRMLALDRLKLALAQARRENTMVAVMFLDLDNFKHINDTMGHDAGDSMLIEAARRVSSCLRGTSTVARLGGDEFLIILPSLSSADATEQVAERILHTFDPPFQIQGREVFVSTSIGIAIYPLDSDSSGSLLQNADAAMYEAKNSGKDAFRRFSPEMKEGSQQRLQTESLLRRALELEEFELNYQPIVRLNDDGIIGAEALLRWRNPTLGTVPPDRFIPLAEETGMIISIGQWVINEACAAIARWRKQTGQPMTIAVNVSPRQFRDPHFVDIVKSALEENDIPGACLELEITERLILDSTLETHSILRQLDEVDVRLSVDDFGTGYSALGYLKSYPFDTLKIDKSFVQDVNAKADDAALVDAIINMAHSLHLHVIAEGVEDAEQLGFLYHHGCDYGQGFYFTQPLPEKQFLAWLRDH